MPTEQAAKGTYALISLGCPKNLVDSERMAGLLRLDGYRMVPDPAGADFVLINTCGFIGDARQESHGVIAEMLELKRRGRLRGVIVAGCLAERDKDALLRKYPGVDQLVGVFAREEIAGAADRVIAGTGGDVKGTVPFSLRENRDSPHRENRDSPQPVQRSVFRPAPARPLADADRLRITPRHLAFLKIAEGCNRLCSFCTIPAIRGHYASKPIEQVVSEAEQLAAEGVRELILVAQDTSFYGLDLYGEPRLAELLARLGRVDQLAWIRLMYVYPVHVSDELIDVLATGGKIVPYLDLPLQHINDEILRRMRRRVTREDTENLLGRLRARIPGLVLRTTLMTGFPGETRQRFQELLRFVRQQQFERLGAFAYSGEPGTAAEQLDGQVPEETRQRRRQRVLAAQQEIAFARNRAQVGRRLDVLIDRDIPGQKNAHIGRTYADAPEIDGVVYVTGEKLSAGQIVRCEIVSAREYDLIGVADQ